MGRKRRRASSNLPKYVYERPHGFVFREYKGREDGRTVWGSDIFLCALDAPMSAMYAAYECVITPNKNTLNWLMDSYLGSPQFKKLKPRTQRDYTTYRRLIAGYTMKNGKFFGEASIARIKKTTIRAYLDKYKDGVAPIAANRHIQFLKAAWSWAEQRLDDIPENPCKGVTLNAQTPRDRYITQAEFAAFKATTKGYIPVFMELAYLCRARWAEVSRIKSADILPEGIRLARSKGSDSEITRETPRLRRAIADARSIYPGAPAPISGAYLVHDKRGAPIKQNAFQTAWGRAMRDWAAKGNERFTFHDLKAAGYSDQVKQDAGHRSERMHRVYSRKLRIVEPAE